MKTYKNRNTGSEATELWLRSTGFDTERPAILAQCGWLEIKYEYPPFNARLQRAQAEGEPVLSASGSCFVQNFRIVDKSESDLQWQLKIERDDKLMELDEEFRAAEACGRLDSAAGFAIDATERAKRDIDGLITKLEAGGEVEAAFCDADNAMRLVSLDQLRAMRLEIIEYGQALYARKWELREAINAAQNFEELDAVTVSFAEV